MRSSFRLGRLFGIELRVDSSWVFVFALVSWSLSSLFASWHPDWTIATTWAVAVVAALTFFASVLLHEMAHSIVARLYGLEVRDITLHLFGGVSNIEREPPTPGAEFLIAVVGPIASVALGIAMLVIVSVATGTARSTNDVEDAARVVAEMGPVTTALMWLGPINVLVGVFNLVPGFPLDGGRLLRSVLWKLSGDLRRATHWAAAIGQLVGVTFMIFGAFMAFGYSVPFFGRGLVGGIWLALIGMFLRNAARQHEKGLVVHAALAGIKVRNLMRTNGPWLRHDLPLRAVVEGWLVGHDERAFPVFDGANFAGLVSADDLARVSPGHWQEMTVREIMTPRERLVVADPNDDLLQAVETLGAKGVGQLPVMAGGRLVGLLFEADIARWLALRARPDSPAAPRHLRHV